MNYEILIPDIVLSLRALNEENPQFLARVTASFQNTSGNMVAEMEQALSERDAGALARTAHSLKGSASSLGSRRVSQSCADLQSMAEEQDWEKIEDVMARLPSEIEEFRKALNHALI